MLGFVLFRPPCRSERRCVGFRDCSSIMYLNTIPHKGEKVLFRSSGAITYGVFEEKIQSPAVRDYFETWPGDIEATFFSYPDFFGSVFPEGEACDDIR